MKSIFDRDTWQEIFVSLGQNKIRTIITIIGVLWGIFLYVVLSGVAKGVDNGFEKQFERISSNMLFIWAEYTSIPYEGFKINRSHLSFFKLSGFYSEFNLGETAIRIFLSIWYHN